jgi:hypothetical protein
VGVGSTLGCVAGVICLLAGENRTLGGGTAGGEMLVGGKVGGAGWVWTGVVGVALASGGAVVVEVAFSKISASCLSAARLLSLMGAIGAADDGKQRAHMRSWAAEITMSAEEAVGIGILDGSQTTVSATHSEVVSSIHTR